MCLTLNYNNLSAAYKARKNPLVAKQDIVVFKMLKKVGDGRKTKYQSPYRTFEYNRGTHYYEEKGNEFGKKVYASWGKVTMDINQGLHAYTTLEKADMEAYRSSNLVIFKMIIPKGSLYYINVNSREIVADNLIFPYNARNLKK